MMPTNPFSRLLTRAIDIGVLASGWWLIALSFFTCVEIIGRKFFQFSLQGVDEVGAYTLAVTSALGFSYTLITRGHVRIDFMIGKLPAGARAVLNTLAMLSLAAMALFAVFRGWFVVSESIEFQSTSTTPLQTPMWIPQSLWYVGLVLFAISACYLAAHACYLLVRERAAVNRFYGPQTLEEEIESETAGTLVKPALAESSTATSKVSS
ncbi:MAG: TRAP transporter small permease [Polaromonas sp.]|nr:TRAP transporter small permease [Polaromonas sp.]